MFAYLDIDWRPIPTQSLPPTGRAPGIVRGDTYAHTVRVTDGVTNGYDDWTFIAQIRQTRLSTATAGDPIAEFTVDLEAAGADLLVHISLDAATTLALSLTENKGFWDLQLSNAGVVTTWLTGKVKVYDDVSRAA